MPLKVKDKNLFIEIRPKNFDSNENKLILLQSTAIESNCNPSCVNGICFKDECKCREGYTGDTCSIIIKVDGIRVSFFVILLIYFGSAIIGILSMYLIYKFFKACCMKSSNINENDEIDMMETWARNQKDENNNE